MKFRISKNSGFGFLIFIILFGVWNANAQRPKLIVTTDIGQDPDDQQSMVRLLHYADQFDLAGLIANADANSASEEPPIIRADIIHRLINEYGKIESNLKQHSKHYPPADYLHSIVKKGCRGNGRDIPVESYIGNGFDTEGSEWIIGVVDKTENQPVIISVWGGACDLAQALWKVRHTRSPEEQAKFISKLRIYFIGKQDSSNDWIIKNFPGLWMILALDRSGDKWQSAYRGMFVGGDMSITSREWLYEHVTGQNPLAGQYPDKTYTGGNKHNPHMAMKEGDSPGWLFFVNNGLNCPGHPEWGGWGGRYEQVRPGFYRDAADKFFDKYSGEWVHSPKATVFRWRADFQDDFVARVQWGVKSYREANHHPVPVIRGHEKENPVMFESTSGQYIEFDASSSTDPDDDGLSFEWFIYKEAGTYEDADNSMLNQCSGEKISLFLPHEAKGKNIHLILRLKDDNQFAVPAYKRIVVQVR